MRNCSNPVIPNVVRDLVFSAVYEDEILRLRLRMTIVTQSLWERARVRAKFFD
jgi:hypothetical protein